MIFGLMRLKEPASKDSGFFCYSTLMTRIDTDLHGYFLMLRARAKSFLPQRHRENQRRALKNVKSKSF
jgi:hypothetical protein